LRTGLSERAISDLERGLRRNPQRATVRLLIDALDLSAEEAESLELAAREHLTAVSTQAKETAFQNNLPSSLTSFIGREDEIARLQPLLGPRTDHAREVRLMTLTGAGGCGKTRLALELAHRVLVDFPDGVWFVDLSSITDARLVPMAVLSAMGGGRESSDQTPLEAMLRRVHGRTLLLVLDNCEHLVQACAELVGALLGATSGLRVLATSREALRVPGEFAWRVPSLAVPASAGSVHADQLQEYASVKLLVDRILQVQPEFVLEFSNSVAVAQVCNRLDGIPLALELAAARIVAMSVQDIAARLDDCFHLLTGGSRLALERQRTLRATIGWSHDLLSETERILFRRLAVFAGGWTVEAAETVCADEQLPSSEILDTLMRLIDQSLVSVHVEDGHTRYRFLETVRVYAAEQLWSCGEAAAVRTRHCNWCLVFAERAAAGLVGSDQFAWFRLVTEEHDNLRAALDWCATEPGSAEAELRIAAAMGQFWWPRKPVEGRRRLMHALDRAEQVPNSARATALRWQALFERNFGDPNTGRKLAHIALADARAVGDTPAILSVLYALALLTREEDLATRLSVLEEAVALSSTAGIKEQVAERLALLATALVEAGDLQRARVLLDEAERLTRTESRVRQRVIAAHLGWLAIAEGRLEEAEARFRGARTPSNWGSAPAPVLILALAHVRLLQGDVEQARVIDLEALVRLQESEPGGRTMADALVDLACVEEVAGMHEKAQRLLGANEAWYAAHGGAGQVWRPFTRSPLKRGLVPVPPVPTDPYLLKARAEGRAMSLDEAAALALEA
jgi:predicted ATPase